VGKATGDEELQLVFSAQQNAVVLSVGGRTGTQVYRYVQHLSAEHPNQLGLGVYSLLIVQAPQYAIAGARLVVLHEVHMQAQLLVEALLVEAFKKASPGIRKYGGLDDHAAFQGGSNDFHIWGVV